MSAIATALKGIIALWMALPKPARKAVVDYVKGIPGMVEKIVSGDDFEEAELKPLYDQDAWDKLREELHGPS